MSAQSEETFKNSETESSAYVPTTDEQELFLKADTIIQNVKQSLASEGNNKELERLIDDATVYFKKAYGEMQLSQNKEEKAQELATDLIAKLKIWAAKKDGERQTASQENE